MCTDVLSKHGERLGQKLKKIMPYKLYYVYQYLKLYALFNFTELPMASH